MAATQPYTPNLGQQPDADAKRDAIHIAVAPVVAAEFLHPGDRVRLDEDGKAHWADVKESVGLVDPFLDQVVLPNERFWLLFNPSR